jgi:predicted transcriptional regulator
MLTSKQAREIINEVVEKEIMERREKAKQYCENELNSLIEERAKSKCSNLTLKINENKMYITTYLKENGYDIKYNFDNTVTISW